MEHRPPRMASCRGESLRQSAVSLRVSCLRGKGVCLFLCFLRDRGSPQGGRRSADTLAIRQTSTFQRVKPFRLCEKARILGGGFLKGGTVGAFLKWRLFWGSAQHFAFHLDKERKVQPVLSTRREKYTSPHLQKLSKVSQLVNQT